MTSTSNSNTLKRAPRYKRFTLWLLNDSVNTMQQVCAALQGTVPGYNVLRAEQVAMIAHYNGKAEVCSMTEPDIYIVQAKLMSYGLSVRLTFKK